MSGGLAIGQRLRVALQRRWQEPIIVVASLIALCCTFYGNVIFGDRTVVPIGIEGALPSGPVGYARGEDVSALRYRRDSGAFSWTAAPATALVASAYRDGKLPLWNPYQGFGAPLLAAAQPGGFDLLRLPAIIGGGSSRAWEVYVILRAFLGALAAYAFGRRIGLAIPAGITLAIAYVWSGHFVINEPNFWVEIYYLLPLLLLAIEVILGDRPYFGIPILTAAVALAILAGMPEVTLMVFLYGSGYGLWRIIEVAVRQRPKRGAIVALHITCGWLVGIGLAAPFLLPLAEYTRVSSAIIGHREQNGVLAAPLADLAVWFMPLLNAPSFTKLQVINSYAGTAVCLLACYGAMPQAAAVWRRLVPFALVAICCLLALIYGAPVFSTLSSLPPLNIVIIRHWAAPLVNFALASLAAAGIHRLVMASQFEQKRTLIPILLFFTIFCLGLGLNVSRLGSFTGLFVILSSLGAIGILLVRRYATRFGLAAPGYLLIVIAELFLLAPIASREVRQEPLAAPPYLASLPMSTSARSTYRIYAADGALYPNMASVFGLADIRNLDALYVDRYITYVRTFLNPSIIDRFTGRPEIGSHGEINGGETALIANPWFDLTGVRYVVSTVAGEIAQEAQAQYSTIYQGEVTVWENHHAAPRAFIAPSVLSVSDETAALTAMTTSGLSPTQEIVVEGLPVQTEAMLNGTGTATIDSDELDRVSITTSTTASALLVLTDTFYPGWEARIDNERTTIYPTDVLFRGIIVPPGVHQVTFSYAPRTFTIGVTIAGTSVLLLSTYVAFVFAMMRRSRLYREDDLPIPLSVRPKRAIPGNGWAVQRSALTRRIANVLSSRRT